jgi:predicted esterase
VSIRAPKRVPLDELGFHWADDLVVDSSTGEIEANGPSFAESKKLVGESFVKDTLIRKVGYQSRDVLIFGFGQGASVGFAVALDSADELGGVVSIGGCLPVDIVTPLKTKNRTPILLCKGERLSGVSDNEIKRIKDAFEFVEVVEWHKTADGMPTNREEMLPIMKFFARRLRSMKGVPKGSIGIR